MYGKIQESRVADVFSLDMYLNYLGAGISKAQNASCFLHPGFPQAHGWWANAVANGLILVELEWQATFFSLQY